MNTTQEAAALAFIGYFRESWPADLDDPLKLVTEDCYYQGVVPTTGRVQGKAAIKAVWESMKVNYGDQRHDMRGVASAPGIVFTERTDYCFTGGKWITIPLVAVFEVNEQNLITAWREYLDPGNVANQMGMDVNALTESLNEAHASA